MNDFKYANAEKTESTIHPSHHRSGFKPFPDKLHVVTAISNPVRYRSRYELYRAFEKRVSDAGAILHTVEIAFGGRPFEITETGNPFHLQLRTNTEIWHKENALNLGIQRAVVSHGANYLAWVDADVQFARPDWAQETLHQLQHYSFVQMFSHAQDLGPSHEPLGTSRSFASTYVNSPGTKIGTHSGSKAAKGSSGGGNDWHSGYAWAATRSALDSVGGLFDKAILGSADWHMAAALIGQVNRTTYNGAAPGYTKALMDWQNLAEKNIKRNLGYVDGHLHHFWHGSKSQRGYNTRYKILVNNQYDPATDLRRDTQGLYVLTDRSIQLRDQIRAYFRSRNEDSIDV